MCARVEDWSREKLTKLNTIKEVFVNGIICTAMARRKKEKKKKKIHLHNNDQLADCIADYKNKNPIGGSHFCRILLLLLLHEKVILT